MGYRRRTGSTLVVVLLLLALMLVLGLGMLSRIQWGYRTSASLEARTQAKHLALSGLDDFRAKRAREIGFPPSLAGPSPHLSYVEEVEDSGGVPLGNLYSRGRT